MTTEVVHRARRSPVRRVRLGGAVLVALLLAGLGVGASITALDVVTAEPAAAQCAPRISVSKTGGLAPGGETVNVSGTCFDVNKGIYVAFCVVPAPGAVPSPCGGGVDMSGANGLSHWISSNPPPYGVGVAVPYGPGGSFNVSMRPAATLNPTIDCRQVHCAIVTRNDHTRTADRSQDVIVPVSFAADPAPAPVVPDPAPLPPTIELPSFELPAETTTTVAPEETTTTTSTTVAPTDVTTGSAEGDGGEDELAVDPVSSSGSSGGPSGGLIAAIVVAVLLVVGAGGWFFARHRVAGVPSGSDGPDGAV